MHMHKTVNFDCACPVCSRRGGGEKRRRRRRVIVDDDESESDHIDGSEEVLAHPTSADENCAPPSPSPKKKSRA